MRGLQRGVLDRASGRGLHGSSLVVVNANVGAPATTTADEDEPETDEGLSLSELLGEVWRGVDGRAGTIAGSTRQAERADAQGEEPWTPSR